jgi:putative hydrolase of HD superfamily
MKSPEDVLRPMPTTRRKRNRLAISKKDTEALLDLMAEVGMLKYVRRSGWWMIGIKHGESVADHSFRTAWLGYLLAKMEGEDPYPVVMMCLLNDLHEARINDLHKVGHRYIDFPTAERKASKEQLSKLPYPIQKELDSWVKEFHSQRTRASQIARDADLLECMIQGKEYADQGHPRAWDWVNRPMHLIVTPSARLLARRLKRFQSDRWWQNLVTLRR